MKSFLKLVLLIVTFFASSICIGQEYAPNLQEFIQKHGNAADKAYLDGKLDLLWSYYADDVIQMPNFDTRIQGIEAVKKRENESRKAGLSVKKLIHVVSDVWKCGDSIYEVGSYRMSFIMPGFPHLMHDQGKYLNRYVIDKNGDLKIKLEIWNTDLNPLKNSAKK